MVSFAHLAGIVSFALCQLTDFVIIAEIPSLEPSADNHNAKAYQEAKLVLDFGPDRLGHALLLPPSLQRILRDKQIPVESCPTSNIMTLELSKQCSGSLLEGIRAHPQLQSWLTQCHPICIATDDPGVFDTTATKELLLIQKGFELTKKDLIRIVIQSMDFAFCDDTTKRRVCDRMHQEVDSV